MQLLPDRIGGEQDEVELHVGRRHFRIGLEEAARIAGPDGEETLAQQRVAQARRDTARHAAHHVVDGVARVAAIVEARLIMILQVGADAFHIGDHFNPVLPQEIGGPDAGELQQLRRVECAARNNHLGVGARRVGRVVLAVFDADRAAPLE